MYLKNIWDWGLGSRGTAKTAKHIYIYFETGSHSVAQAGFVTLLLQSLKW
jgi:hypothetical protein